MSGWPFVRTPHRTTPDDVGYICLYIYSKVLDLECNVRKTKCMVINPTDSRPTKIVSKVFPHFMINGQSVEFVQEFRYLDRDTYAPHI